MVGCLCNCNLYWGRFIFWMPMLLVSIDDRLHAISQEFTDNVLQMA